MMAMDRMVTRIIALVLTTLLIGVVGWARIDQIEQKPTISQTEISPLHDDSGCIKLFCGGVCVENFGNWVCRTKERSERYDEQMQPLPILVRVRGDCWVCTLYGNYYWSCTRSVRGSGCVTAYTQCTKFAVFVTLAGNDGWCSCQER
jgi:hypothetical protein